jgi:hypothetical protein
MHEVKHRLRGGPLRAPYRWLANRYRALRRLWIYPKTAHVGDVDYDEYWDHKAPASMGQLSDWRLRRAQVLG